MNNNKTGLVLLAYGLGFALIAWGAFGFDPRLGIISIGVGFVLIGFGLL